MRALGIDPGMWRLGWAVVDVVEGDFSVEAKGIIQKSHPNPYRLAKLITGIMLGKASEYKVD